jgi:transcriptional regulator with XRE-family HTH domain
MRTRKGYEPDRFVPFLESLLEEANESAREASLESGLDHGAVQRYLRKKGRPSQDTCIAMANHFGINPNVMLSKAGYPPQPYFDLSLTDPNEFAPEVKEVAMELMKIENPQVRRRVCDAVLSLTREMFTAAQDSHGN